MWSSLCARLCPNLFLKCHRSCGIKATPPTLCHLHDLLKGPVSGYSHSLGSWGPGLPHADSEGHSPALLFYVTQRVVLHESHRKLLCDNSGLAEQVPRDAGSGTWPCAVRSPSLSIASASFRSRGPPGSRGGGTGTPALRGGMVRICSCPLIPAEAQTSWEKSGEMRLQAQVMLGGKTGESPSGTRVSHVARG